MKRTTLLISFFITLLFTGCAQLRQSTCEQPRTYIYNDSSDRLFETTLAMLQSEGFTITLSDKQRGIIQTRPIKINEQTALALFDKTYDACNCKLFSIRFTITPISNQISQPEKSRLSVSVLSNEQSNGILEQTLLSKLAVKLGTNDTPTPAKIDVAKLPVVHILTKDHLTVEGYLLDDSNREYLRLKLKSGGIMHIERSDIERYTLASESASIRN
jgi:hypothetical protein